MAEIFDILLFKTNRAISEGIRLITDSEFDHAAMVLKFSSQPNKVMFLHVTGNLGVHLTDYDEIRNLIGTFFIKVAIRHVEMERTQE